MRLIKLLDWDISYRQYVNWCVENNVHILKVNMATFRLKEEDYLAFALTFDKGAKKKPSMFRDEE